MPGFTVSAAARLCGVDRRTIQRAIHTGRLSLDAQHCLSREALIAAGYLDATPQETPHDTSQGMPQELDQATALLALLGQLTTAITALHAEVRELRAELRQLPQRRRRHVAFRSHQTPQEAPQVPPQAAPTRQPRRTPPPPPRPSPDIDGAYARMRDLQAEGRTLTQIAAQLTAEGLRTKLGRPWHKSTVAYVLRTHGR